MTKINYMEVTSYNEGSKRADVVRTVGQEPNYFGCRYYVNNNALGIEWYPTHSVRYSQDAAENYIKGIKKYSPK